MSFRFSAAVLAAGLALPLLAQQPAKSAAPSAGAVSLATPLPRDPKVTIGTLPNGIRYYIRTNKKPEKRAELLLVVNAGSASQNA